MNADCIFCKIVAGQIPCTKVFEDDRVLAFLDLHPVNVGHTLVIPKEHFENCTATSDEALADVTAAAKKIGAAALAATGAEGYNLALNCGPVAGQVVMHTHLHVIPRFADDGLKHWPKRDVAAAESAAAAEKMRQLLAS